MACDEDQLGWWRGRGEAAVCPRNVTELLGCLDRAGVFIGNDSGPGHLAASCGLPTFTLFGPQLHEWFAPLHPAAEVVDGPGLPLQAVLGLLPFCRAVLPARGFRGGGLAARGAVCGAAPGRRMAA